MKINLLNDLIVDEYGNYYVATKGKTGGDEPSEYTLVNAFMFEAFSKIVTDNFVKEHNYQYVGRGILDTLKNHIELCKSDEHPSKLIELSEVQKSCKVYFTSLFERDPNVK